MDGGNCCIKLNAASGKVEVYARTHSKFATHKSFDTVKAMFAGYVKRHNNDPVICFLLAGNIEEGWGTVHGSTPIPTIYLRR